MVRFINKFIGSKPKEHVQIPVAIRMRNYDDVFNNVIISLERLEMFLELERKNGEKPNLRQTAVMTERDIHRDNNQPVDKEQLFYELELQCSALYYQTKFDDEKLYRSTTRYFLNDLLEWYGGRNMDIPYNEVDQYALPIITVLTRQIDNFGDINKIIEKYIGISIDTEMSLTREDVQNAFEAFIIATDKVQEQHHKLLHSEEKVELTVHQRGNAIDGYKRLFLAFVKLYNESMPSKKLIRSIADFLPEISDACKDINEDVVDKYLEREHGDMSNKAEITDEDDNKNKGKITRNNSAEFVQPESCNQCSDEQKEKDNSDELPFEPMPNLIVED